MTLEGIAGMVLIPKEEIVKDHFQTLPVEGTNPFVDKHFINEPKNQLESQTINIDNL